MALIGVKGGGEWETIRLALKYVKIQGYSYSNDIIIISKLYIGFSTMLCALVVMLKLGFLSESHDTIVAYTVSHTITNICMEVHTHIHIIILYYYYM